MPVAPAAGVLFARPIRSDSLDGAAARLRRRYAACGLVPADAAALARSLVAFAKLTREIVGLTQRLVRSGAGPGGVRALDGLGAVAERLRRRIEDDLPLLERSLAAATAGGDVQGAAELWFQGGTPGELGAESRLLRALQAQLLAAGKVRSSDLAHLACLWSDSQRLHSALRELLRGGGPHQAAAFLQGVLGTLRDHILPVDLVGLPGEPGLAAGLPAMASRLRAAAGR